MNKVTILLFASLRDAAGRRTLGLALPSGATVADLKEALVAEHPALAPWLEAVKVAVDHEYAGEGDVIPENAEIALIPPVSGG